MSAPELCPSFHGGGGSPTVYYCVQAEGHDGPHRDQLGREWPNRGAR